MAGISCSRSRTPPRSGGESHEAVRLGAPVVSYGDVVEPAADLVNPLHRLAIGEEHEDGAVVDDDLDLALVVLDVKM